MAHTVFIGPPGCGKGTQCTALAQLRKVPHVSTGEMLRDLIASNTALSRWIASRLDRGHFAPDHMVLQMVGERLRKTDCKQGCLLDGFPRTLAQAAAMDTALGDSCGITAVVQLEVPENVLIQRLSTRGQLEGRADDSRTAVLERMRVYHDLTEPLLGYYSRTGRLHRVDADAQTDQVTARICEVFGWKTHVY